MALPNLNIKLKVDFYGIEEDGLLINQYRPFQNLKISDPTEIDIGDLNIPLSKAELNISSETTNIYYNLPLELSVEPSYDDSVNLIVNDKINPPKIVNSRFYLTDSSNYKIADRKGNLDTNIYTENNFSIETSLTKLNKSVVTLDFNGVDSGGKLPVGNYTFYFKLADDDGNETDFVSESGKVVCYIGGVNNPKSIRGGQMDENSDKLVKFTLNNVDLGYSHIIVYYTRSSGDETIEFTKSYKITDKFKITSLNQEITITGFENIEEIDNSEINLTFANFDSVKSIENCQNITFAAGIEKNYTLFRDLENISLHVTPSLYTSESIGDLNELYEDSSLENPYEYYNPSNIYYRLGYWNEEIYRFGIVYILPNFTLSPVFNVRGVKELTESTSFIEFTTGELIDSIKVGENYSIIGETDTNSKGVFKIKYKNGTVKPIGIKFDISLIKNYLKNINIRGYFIVRQKRIPTILCQALSISTSTLANIPLLKNDSSYFSESFIKWDDNSKPKLGRSIFNVADIKKNALLCPEATLRPYVFNNFFNSSEYNIKQATIKTNNNVIAADSSNKLFYFKKCYSSDITDTFTKANLTLIEPGIELIGNKSKFSSKAGNPLEAWKTRDPNLGDINDLSGSKPNWDRDWSNSNSLVRGEFNSYIGVEGTELSEFGQYYNIFLKDYDFEKYWSNYFKLRYNDFSPYFAVTDRIDINSSNELIAYRGDCYLVTYTHRMLWNFIDPDLPTNTKILDPYTWYKNYKVREIKFKDIGGLVIGMQDDSINTDPSTASDDVKNSIDISYKKILDVFTFKTKTEFEPNDLNWMETAKLDGLKILLPEDRKFNKYSESNGIFGTSKINRPDVNAVPIGHWVTFKIQSNYNLGLRDIDFKNPQEEAIHRTKRSFYPLQQASPEIKLPESKIINQGLSKTLSDKYYFVIPDVPFIKTDFTNRIYYSNILQEASFINGNREFKAQNYQDYTREHGAFVKLVEWYGTLIAVMEHGILMIPVNERAMMANSQGENVYINTENVLPKNPKVLSNTFGSTFPESIIKTSKFVYGLDTIGKKIWRTNGQQFEIISDMKIQKFLNDHITLSKLDRDNMSNSYSVKTHYNAFKQDVLFTFFYGNEKWNLCWNEILNKWCTRYSWFPLFSENINNIFYTFANNSIHSNKGSYLFKHGFAGDIQEVGEIKPTTWYDTTYPFEFEFIVNGVQGVQKIFDNLKIISNSTKPNSLYYEIVGDGFGWNDTKSLIYSLNDFTLMTIKNDQNIDVSMPIRGIETDKEYLVERYKTYLLASPGTKKLPFIWVRDLNTSSNWPETISTIKDLSLDKNNKTREISISSYQRGMDIKTEGRLKGNMQYVEDFWDIQIQPITFKYAYIKTGELLFSNFTEMKIRDKYIKIRVKYDGNDYAIINSILTLFTTSYA